MYSTQVCENSRFLTAHNVVPSARIVSHYPGAFVHSCENRSNSDDVIIDLRINLAVHLAHKLFANVKPQPAAANVFCISAAPKALENILK